MASEAEPLPHFRHRPSAPLLEPGAVGILIHTAGIEPHAGAPRWPLRGCFRVPSVDSDEPQVVLQRVVIAITDRSTHNIQAERVFRDALLFREDVREEGQLVAGAFHVDLLKVFEFRVPRETYFVSASIGEEVSPIIRCACDMPWAAPVQ